MTLSFLPGGIHNCSLIALDAQTRSRWLMAEGIALHGPMKGELLDRIPVYHTVYGEWLARHPETLVLEPADDPHHRDQRHGHGDEESFGRPGISPPFVRTLGGDPDCSLAENVMVLAVTHGASTRLYPLDEVRKEGGVVHDVLGGRRIVVWAGPGASSFWMASFYPEAGDRELTFENTGEAFRDLETGSTWCVEGEGLTGRWAGHRLEHTSFSFLRFHGWAWSHRHNDVFRSTAQPVVDEARFRGFLDTLRDHDYDVRVDAELLNLERPNQATHGLRLRIDGDRCRLMEFTDRSAAEDYLHSKPHALRGGKVVLESAPEDRLRYSTPFHTRRLPDEGIPWSRLIDGKDAPGCGFASLFHTAFPEIEKEEMGLVELLEKLRDRGFEVELGTEFTIEGIKTGRWVLEARRSQLRVGGRNALFASIDGDPFMVHKFENEDAAQAYLANEEEHAVRTGRFVFRSTPKNMYYNRAGFGERPAHEISWSKLLADPRLVTCAADILRGQSAERAPWTPSGLPA